MKAIHHGWVSDISESSEEEDDYTPVKKYRLQDLKDNFEPYKVMVSMSCAGNRRMGMKEFNPEVQGNSWYIGAVGNVEYTGILITDLLKELGFDLEHLRDKHLIAESMDVDVLGKHYEVSVPMSMVLDPRNEVILAYQMNGEDLPLEHGYPLRLVVPGTVGVRNAKWVKALTISDEEATSTQQKENYKIVKEKDPKKIDYSKIKPIMGYIVNSAIGDPINKEVVTIAKDTPFYTIKGYAVGNQANGVPVDRVELTFDGGKTWVKSTIVQKEEKAPGSKVFSWVLWEHKVNLLEHMNPATNTVTVTCKCYDVEGNTQDKTMEEINNLKGLLNNTPHTIEFTVKLA